MTKTARKPAAPFTTEDARAALVAKLTKAGPKGATALWPASAAGEKRARFEEALAFLEDVHQVFRDTRKAKPRFFLWSLKPELPTAESVAQKLEPLARARFPVLASAADFGAMLKSQRDEKALVPQALTLLVNSGRLLPLFLRSGKTNKHLYVATAALPAVIPAAPTEIASEVPIREAYARLVATSGFPAVPISTLQTESGVSLETLQAWLLDEYRAGHAVLSLGDWSLADEVRRAAAITLHGQPHLLARLLP